MVLTDILRQAAFFIDSAVYKLIPTLYKLIVYLANVNLFDSSDTLSLLINRIYALVGIFMLFKLSFSIVRYIVDPDSFSDSSRGFTNLIKRVLIAFVLLAIVPYAFERLYKIQNVVITNNVIPNVILGSDEGKTEDLEDAAKDLQFLLFGSFFSINYNAPSYGSCTPTDEYPLANVIGSSDMVLVDEGACFDAFTEGIKDPQVSASGVVLEDFFKTASNDDASSTSDIKDIRRFEAFEPLVNWKDVNDYSINYIPVSVICGIYLVFLLLSFCIDIAGRAIRLLFMQVLSPVAIISSVDPASSSQEDKLKEWIKECFKVFISLFLRLAVVYCVIQLVKIVSESVIPSNASLYYNSSLTNTKNGKSMNLYIYIFLILGAFQVAKKIPELIEKALGIKFSGELQLNPFKNPLIAGAAGLGLAGAEAFGANAIGAYDRTRKLWGDAVEKRKAFSIAKKDLNSGRDNLSARSQQYNQAQRNYNKALDDFNRNPTEDNFKKAEIAEKLRNYAKQKKDDAQRTYDQLEAKANKASKEYADTVSRKKIIHNVSQTASAVVGIPAGGVSGAVRGAIGGYKAGNVLDVAKAASSARTTVTDKRNDRDVIADTYNLRDRVSETISRYANIKGSKHYGTGRIDDDIKGLKNELSNVQQQLSEANRIITRQLQNASSITDSNLKNLVTELRSSSDSSSRNEILNNINNAISNLPSGDPNVEIVRSIAESFKIQDDLMNVNIDINKQISKLQDAMDAGQSGGPKPGGN